MTMDGPGASLIENVRNHGCTADFTRAFFQDGRELEATDALHPDGLRIHVEQGLLSSAARLELGQEQKLARIASRDNSQLRAEDLTELIGGGSFAYQVHWTDLGLLMAGRTVGEMLGKGVPESATPQELLKLVVNHEKDSDLAPHLLDLVSRMDGAEKRLRAVE